MLSPNTLDEYFSNYCDEEDASMKKDVHVLEEDDDDFVEI
jgi:hypothetical protein